MSRTLAGRKQSSGSSLREFSRMQPLTPHITAKNLACETRNTASKNALLTTFVEWLSVKPSSGSWVFVAPWVTLVDPSAVPGKSSVFCQRKAECDLQDSKTYFPLAQHGPMEFTLTALALLVTSLLLISPKGPCVPLAGPLALL